MRAHNPIQEKNRKIRPSLQSKFSQGMQSFSVYLILAGNIFRLILNFHYLFFAYFYPAKINWQSGTNYMDSIFSFCHWSILNIQSIREPHILRLSRERDLKDLQYAKPRKNLGVIGTIHFSLHHNQFFILQVNNFFLFFHNGLQLK